MNAKDNKKTTAIVEAPQCAMILAAGRGLRMRPITDKTPKPMIKVNGQPILTHALQRLEAVGVTDVVINTHHLADKIERYYKDYDGAALHFSREENLLETGGGVKKALSMLGDEPFFVVNSDAFWLNGPTDALARLAMQWAPDKMDALLMLHSTVDAYGYDGLGDFRCEADGKLIRRAEQEVASWLFTGVQILDPKTLRNAPKGSFSLNWVYDRALEEDRLFGMIHDGEWFHIGTPDGLNEAEDYMQTTFAETKHR